MDIYYLPYTILLKNQFSISYHSRSTTPIVLVKIEYQGFTGYGEASLPPYLKETQESVIAFLHKAAKLKLNFTDNFEQLSISLDKIEIGNHAAKACLSMAIHDIIGKMKNKPCYELYNVDNSQLPYTSYTIGIDSEEILQEKIKSAAQFKILKVKLGSSDDKKIINTIRKYTDKPLYIDANQGWKEKETALELIAWLKERNTIIIEQPMPINCYEDMQWLKERSQIPLIADESVQTIGDVEKIKSQFHGINIKLMKCGGMFDAFTMISLAKEMNMKIMFGCMTETSCAVSAAIQFASLADYADLDGNQLITNDPFQKNTVQDGQLLLDDKPGLGIHLKEKLDFIKI